MSYPLTRFLLKALLLASVTCSQTLHAGLLRKCLLRLQAFTIKHTSVDDFEFTRGEVYQIVFNNRVFNLKFLGAKYDKSDFGDLDDLSFQEITTQEILHIPRNYIQGELDDAYSSSDRYAHNKPYKIQTSDGLVINGIFLGEKNNKNNPNSGKIAILNLDNNQVETYFEWEIFHTVRNDSLEKNIHLENRRKLAEEKSPSPPKTNPELNIIRTPLIHDQNPNFKAGVDPKLLAKMTRAQRRLLSRFVNQALARVSSFDANMRRAFPMQRIDDNLTLGFQETALIAYTYPGYIKVNGKDTRFIRLGLDLNRPDLGLDISTVLHERGHHYGSNAGIGGKNGISLLEDEGYREGLADYFMCHEMRDPTLSRGSPEDGLWYRNVETRQELVDGKMRTIRSPLDAEREGRLEGHALSTFYSYPMWRAFVKSQSRPDKSLTPAKLWSDFHSDMERNYEIYKDFRAGYFMDEKTVLSEESEMLQNIDFFYAYLYKEAFLNPKTPPQKREYLQAGYKDAQKSFTLPWSTIELTAEKMMDLSLAPDEDAP